MKSLKSLFRPIHSMETEEAKAFMKKRDEGTYTLLDVRQPSEYTKGHLPGALLVPLPRLADDYKALDRKRPVIVY